MRGTRGSKQFERAAIRFCEKNKKPKTKQNNKDTKLHNDFNKILPPNKSNLLTITHLIPDHYIIRLIQ